MAGLKCPVCREPLYRETHNVTSFRHITLGCNSCDYTFTISGYEHDRMREVINTIFRRPREQNHQPRS